MDGIFGRDNISTRLTIAGVPNLQGWNALSALAEYALTTKMISLDGRLICLNPQSQS